ncbi:helix-turn-helix domain-containing protein [Acetobacter tropicalis]|nr:helix-turn-helix domain-containing protein [Acetobacter tropicalis]
MTIDLCSFSRQLFTEKTAATRLGISLATLKRERRDKKIGYIKIRSRYRYTEDHLTDYLKRNEICPKANFELENISSIDVKIHKHGVLATTNQKQDKQSEHRFAQLFFMKHK